MPWAFFFFKVALKCRLLCILLHFTESCKTQMSSNAMHVNKQMMLGIFALLQQLKQLYVLYVLCQRKFSKKSLKTTAINKWNKEIKLRPKAEWVVYIEHCNLTPNPSPIKFTKVQAHCCHFITGKYFVLTLKLDKDNTILLKYKCKTCCFYNILSKWLTWCTIRQKSS